MRIDRPSRGELLSVRWRRATIASDQRSRAPSSSKIDVILNRLASLSQVGVLSLAVFGYWYTVIPVYQKSLLDEEIAKKTIELNRKTDELSEISTALHTKEAKLSDAENKLQSANSALRDYTAKLSRALTDAAIAKSDAAIRYIELRPRLAGEFISLADTYCRIDKLDGASFSGCLRAKVMVLGNMAPLTNKDSVALINIAKKFDDKIEGAWRAVAKEMELKKSAAAANKAMADDECAKMKGDDKYNEVSEKGDRKREMEIFTHRIDVDYKCRKIRSDAESEDLKIVIKYIGASQKVTYQYATEVANKFLSTAN